MAGNALFQRAGLADVQHAVVGGEHAVHARRGTQAAHELLAVEGGVRGAHAGHKLRAAAHGCRVGASFREIRRSEGGRVGKEWASTLSCRGASSESKTK